MGVEDIVLEIDNEGIGARKGGAFGRRPSMIIAASTNLARPRAIDASHADFRNRLIREAT
jgi:hypothetical protein